MESVSKTAGKSAACVTQVYLLRAFHKTPPSTCIWCAVSLSGRHQRSAPRADVDNRSPRASARILRSGDNGAPGLCYALTSDACLVNEESSFSM